MRKCNRCKEEKEDSGFYIYKRKNNVIALNTICKGCISIRNKNEAVKIQRRIKHKEWVKNNPDRERYLQKRHQEKQRVLILALIDKYKELACCDCGKKYHKTLMEFDHRPGTNKRFCVCKVSWNGRSIKSIQEEIDKCDVVCIMCHRLRTEARYPRLAGEVSSTTRDLRRLLAKVDKIKAETPCAGCGEFFHPRQMDFDHIDPSQKSKGISELRMNRAAWSKIQAEISKCRVLCAACHKLHTKGIVPLPAPSIP